MTAPTKADAAAADRLLKAAVRRAVEMLREHRRYPILFVLGARQPAETLTYTPSSLWLLADDDLHVTAPDPVVAMLTAAGESADLLLEVRDA